MGIYHIVVHIQRSLLAFLACTILLGIFISPSLAETFGEADYYDLILEVRRDRDTLSNAVLGLEKSEKNYLPMQEIARLISIETITDLEQGTISGFVGTEENTYTLNVNTGTYTVKGKEHNFDPSNAFVFTQQFGIGDIYATPDLINQIWRLDLDFDPLQQTADIKTTRKLPYELVSERQRLRDRRLRKLANKADDNSVLELPRIENDYKLFSLPALDINTSIRADNSNGGIGHTFNLRGRNDLLKAQADYNFSFEREAGEKMKFQNARFLLERKSYEDDDMPLGLNLFQAGDIRPRPSRLIDGALKGRGLLLSTEPQKQIRDFDQITVEGIAEPGWEIELYRNNELIGFQTVDNNGEYRFENVTLNFNNTTIRTIAYGPEGQVQEEEEVYSVSSSMLRPGKTIMEASLLDFERDLILTDNRPKNRPEGIAQNIKLKHGLTSWLSAFTSFTSTPTRQSDRKYATLGFNLSLMGMSNQVEAYRDLSGGHAIDIRSVGNFAGTNLNLRTAFLSDFESEEAGYDDNAKTTDIELTARRSVKFPFGNLGLRLRFDHEKFEKADSRSEIDFSQTYFNNGLRLTHGNSINLIDRDHQASDGRINATYRINPNWQLRSLLNYNIFPERHFRNILGELRYKDNDRFTAAIDINRNLQDRGTKLGGQVSYDFDTVRTTLDVDWEKEAGFRAFLRASFSMAPYGKDGSYVFSSKNLANRAALNGRVFLDKNYDGEYDDGDELIEGAEINIGKRGTDPSDDSGYATYTGPPRNEYENITLNLNSLENPFLISPEAGYNTVLRPGTLVSADFPVIETGVIDGTVYSDEGGLAGVQMELLSGDDVIDTTTTAFDGFYTFEYIRPGDYTIRVSPSYEQVNVPPRTISVTSENLFLYGVDFQISEQAKEVACVETNDIGENGRITQYCRDLSTPYGTLGPAHTIINTVIQSISVEQYDDYTRFIMNISSPINFNIVEPKGNKEVTIQFPESVWDSERKWKSPSPKILKRFLAEDIPTGGAQVILEGVKTIRVEQSIAVPPNDTHGHQIYFDLIK